MAGGRFWCRCLPKSDWACPTLPSVCSQGALLRDLPFQNAPGRRAGDDTCEPAASRTRRRTWLDEGDRRQAGLRVSAGHAGGQNLGLPSGTALPTGGGQGGLVLQCARVVRQRARLRSRRGRDHLRQPGCAGRLSTGGRDARARRAQPQLKTAREAGFHGQVSGARRVCAVGREAGRRFALSPCWHGIRCQRDWRLELGRSRLHGRLSGLSLQGGPAVGDLCLQRGGGVLLSRAAPVCLRWREVHRVVIAAREREGPAARLDHHQWGRRQCDSGRR